MPGALSEALASLKDITAHLAALALEGKVEIFLADSTLYLELFGIITVAWQWLLQGLAIQKALSSDLSEMEKQFYQGKFIPFAFSFIMNCPRSRDCSSG